MRWKIRVLLETLALALRGETLIRWRKDPSERKRRNPSVQEGEANAARRSSSEPSAQGRRTLMLQRGALAFKEKDLVLTLQGEET